MQANVLSFLDFSMHAGWQQKAMVPLERTHMQQSPFVQCNCFNLIGALDDATFPNIVQHHAEIT